MKLKRSAILLTAVLAVSALGACSDKDQTVQFNKYWNYDSLVHEVIDETLEYTVTFEAASGVGTFDYTVSYGEGENAGKYVTNLKSETTAEGENVYRYTTLLTLKVTYEYKGQTATFDDSVYTETVFSEDRLMRPISSKKQIVSHSPVNGGGSSLEKCYSAFSYEVVTTYAADGNATSVVTNYADPENPVVERNASFKGANGKYTYLDNEQLLFALRGVASDVTSAKVRVYSPFVDTVQQIKLAFDDETGASFKYRKNGEEVTEDVSYRPVTLKINESNPGATQTAWIASATNPTKNATRNVMLRLETPLSYGLGTLVYNLDSITR